MGSELFQSFAACCRDDVGDVLQEHRFVAARLGLRIEIARQ